MPIASSWPRSTTRPSEARWKKFQTRYSAELDANADAVAEPRRKTHEGPVTFVYAARDEQHDGALALKAYLQRRRS